MDCWNSCNKPSRYVDGRIAGHLGAVRDVVRRRSLQDGIERHRAADQVVDERTALAEQLQRHRGRQDVVLDQVRPVADLDEQVATVAVAQIP